MKTICIISPSLQGGGIERALTTLSKHFVNRGHRVIFIVCRSGNHFYTLDPRVELSEPDFRHTASPVKKLFSYFNIISFIRKQLKKYKPDTILSFGDIVNPVALIANRGLGYPIFISDRISPLQKLDAFKRFMKSITYPHATGIIAQTKVAAEYKYKTLGKNINLTVIPNSLRKIDDYHEEKHNWIIGVGRLSYEKGFDRLIKAFADIKGHDDWQLVLAGDGPLSQQLKQQVEELGISERVQFRGMVKEIDKLLSQCRIFVMPSRCEGFPNALAEAMASPLACISFDSVPTENLITDNVDGLIVKDGNIEGLSSSISFLIENEEKRKELAQKAIEIRNRLDEEKIGDAILDFITKNNN